MHRPSDWAQFNGSRSQTRHQSGFFLFCILRMPDGTKRSGHACQLTNGAAVCLSDVAQ